MRTGEITKIRSSDDTLNRVQDEVRAKLNPVLRSLGTTPTVSGSTGGNAALKSLIQALAQIGLVLDKTT